MGSKNRIIPVGDEQSFVSLLDETELSRLPGDAVGSIEKYKKDIKNMSDAVKNGGFKGEFRNGFAIAHHQISKLHARFFVIRPDIAEKYFGGHEVIINPQLLSTDGGELTKGREACLSHPYRGTRRKDRYNRVRAAWVDAEGKGVEMILVDLGARIFQHELDHCAGRTIWMS